MDLKAQPGYTTGFVYDFDTTKDNNRGLTSQPGSDPYSVVRVGDKAYFVASSGRTDGYNSELWESDGTEHGTRMVKEFYSFLYANTIFHSYIQKPLNFRGEVFFDTWSFDTIPDPSASRRSYLWKKDGKTSAIYPITGKKFPTGRVPSSVGYYTDAFVFSNHIIYVKRLPSKLYGIYAFDGSDTGVRHITTIYYHDQPHFFHPLVRTRNNLFFQSYLPNDYVLICRIDTSFKIDTLFYGHDTTNVQIVKATDQHLYISTRKSFLSAYYDLWKTDSTYSTFTLVKDSLGEIMGTAAGNKYMYFEHGSPYKPTSLYRTDGTDTGTEIIAKLPPLNYAANPALMCRFIDGDTIYFVLDSAGKKAELWRSDGTASGTIHLIDFTNSSRFSVGMDMVKLGSKIYFNAYDGMISKLYVTDGTPQGTMLVKDPFTGKNFLQVTNVDTALGKLWVTVVDSVYGSEPWVSDSSGTSFRMLKDLRRSNQSAFGKIYGGVYHSATLKDTLYFARDGLFKVTAKKKSTQDISGVLSSNSLYSMANTVTLGDYIYFNAYQQKPPSQGTLGLWKTDGTIKNTSYVSSFLLPGKNQAYKNYVVTGKHIIYSYNSAVYRTDGTSAGTILLKSIPGWQFFDFVQFNGYTYFIGTSNTVWYLYRTDGTQMNTIQLGKTHTRANNDYAFTADTVWLTPFKNKLYFSGNPGGLSNNELSVSDGAFTMSLLTEIQPGQKGSDPKHLVTSKDYLFFTAWDSLHGRELWKTDGTASGTVLVKDIATGLRGSNPRELTVMKDILYFVATDSLGDHELWRSDGTESGTYIVKDIFPRCPSSPHELKVFNDTLYFFADDGVHGKEPWVSDGTTKGTILADDIIPGAQGSAPFGMQKSGNTIYFHGWHSEAGFELYAFGKCDLKAKIDKPKKTCVNTRVDFYDSSKIEFGEVKTWNWYFGDGKTSSEKNPGHVYTQAGNYTVSLVVSAGYYCRDSTSFQITVGEYPDAQFALNNYTQCYDGNTFKFTAPDTLISKYAWDFGDGSVSADTSPSHIYINPGVYPVKLTALSAYNCSSVFIDTVTVLASLIASIRIDSDKDQCLTGNSYTFVDKTVSGSSIKKRQWFEGKGNSVSTMDSFTYSFADPGSYDIILVVQSENGCVDTARETVTVWAEPKAAFSIDDAEQCLRRNKFSFATVNANTGTGSLKYLWDFGDGKIDTAAKPEHTYTKAGSYMIYLLLQTEFGCTDSFYNYVDVFPTPGKAAITGNDTVTANNEYVYKADSLNADKFIWTVTNGVQTSGGFSSSIRVKWSATASAGSVSVVPVTDEGCTGDTVRLSVKISKGSGIEELFSESLVKIYPNPAQDHINVEIAGPDAGIYTVRLFNARGAVIYKQEFSHTGGNFKTSIPLSGNIPPGTYILDISAGGKAYRKPIQTR